MREKLYTVDFSSVKYYPEIHRIIQRSLDFPEDYGCNWSAFWDCLTDMYGQPVHIVVFGLDVIGRKFDDAADKMMSIFTRFKYYEKSFEKDIQIEIVSGNTRTQI